MSNMHKRITGNPYEWNHFIVPDQDQDQQNTPEMNLTKTIKLMQSGQEVTDAIENNQTGQASNKTESANAKVEFKRPFEDLTQNHKNVFTPTVNRNNSGSIDDSKNMSTHEEDIKPDLSKLSLNDELPIINNAAHSEPNNFNTPDKPPSLGYLTVSSDKQIGPVRFSRSKPKTIYLNKRILFGRRIFKHPMSASLKDAIDNTEPIKPAASEPARKGPKCRRRLFG